MRAASDRTEYSGSLATEYVGPRLRVIVADGTPRYLETVRSVLDLHDIVDLVGRAANFEETIQLAVELQPDMVLIDIQMPSAMLAFAAIITTVRHVYMVGLFAGRFPPDAAALILSVNVFVDKARLRDELLPLLPTIHRYRTSLNSF